MVRATPFSVLLLCLNTPTNTTTNTVTHRHNFTNVPRTVEEVEAVMAGAEWPVGGAVDGATEPAAKKARAG